jgi:hypothetical protein
MDGCEEFYCLYLLNGTYWLIILIFLINFYFEFQPETKSRVGNRLFIRTKFWQMGTLGNLIDF